MLGNFWAHQLISVFPFINTSLVSLFCSGLESHQSLSCFNYLSLFLCTAVLSDWPICILDHKKSIGISFNQLGITLSWFVGSLGDQYLEGIALLFQISPPTSSRSYFQRSNYDPRYSLFCYRNILLPLSKYSKDRIITLAKFFSTFSVRRDHRRWYSSVLQYNM